MSDTHPATRPNLPKTERTLYRVDAATFDSVPCTDRLLWDRLMQMAPVPHLTQDWAYARGKVAGGSWRVRHWLIRRGGGIRALLTVLERRVAGVTVASRINRGPILIGPEADEVEWSAILSEVRRRTPGIVFFAPSLPDTELTTRLLSRLGFRKWQAQGWRSGRIDLDRSEADILAGFTPGFRSKIRQAERAGVEVEVRGDDAAFDWQLDRHTENMRDKGFTAFSPLQLRALRSAALPGNVTLLRVVSDGEPVAGVSVVRFADHAEYHIGWFGPKGRELNAGNVLMWHAMCEMRRQGVVSFDVGGLREGDGYTRFKRGMRPVEYRLTADWVGLGGFG